MVYHIDMVIHIMHNIMLPVVYDKWKVKIFELKYLNLSEPQSQKYCQKDTDPQPN